MSEYGDFDFDAQSRILREAKRRGDPVAKLLAEMLADLGNSSLDISDKHFNAGALIDMAGLHDSDLLAVGRDLLSRKQSISQAVVAHLPSEFRASLYAGERRTITGQSNRDARQDTGLSLSRPPSEQAELTSTPETPILLLVGTEQEHAANVALAKAECRQVQPLRVPSIDAARRLFAEPVCGMVLGASVWSASSDEHPALLDEILALSSYMRIYINASSLSAENLRLLSEQIEKFKSIYNCQLPIVILGSANISVADLLPLERVSALFQIASAISLHPDELNQNEGALLRMVVQSSASRFTLNPDIQIQRIDTRTFSVGKSGARTLFARVGSLGHSLVVKFDRAQDVKEEVRRFTQYIRRIDNSPPPSLVYHGDASAVVFETVLDAGTDYSPAKSLRTELDEVALSEVDWGTTETEANVFEGIRRSVAWLEKLSRLPAEAKDAQDYSWLHATVSAFLRNGGVLSLTNFKGVPIDVGASSLASIEAVIPHSSLCCSHGDINLENVLLVDNRVPKIIDFRWTGLGHPCMDIVRLFAVMFFRYFRCCDGEESAMQLVMRVIEGLTVDDLFLKFPAISSTMLNRILIRTFVEIRTCCIRLQANYRLSDDQYLHVLYLHACFGLTRTDLQHSVTRATVRSLASVLH